MQFFEIKFPRGIENPFLQMEQVWNVFQESRSSGVMRIMNVNDRVCFIVDENLRDVLYKPLASHFEGVEIAEFNMESRHIDFLFLKQSNLSFYPIKRYSQTEDKISRTIVDPALIFYESLENGEWIEFEIFPVSQRLRKFYMRILKMIHNGFFANFEFLQKFFIALLISRNNFVRFLFFPIWVFLYFKTFFVGSINNVPKYDLLREEVTQQHYRETAIEAAMDKINKPLIGCVARLPKCCSKHMIDALGGLKLSHSNSFELANWRNVMVFNTEEMATILHFPSFEESNTRFNMVYSKKLAFGGKANEFEYQLGVNEFMGINRPVGLDLEARRRHLYVVGKTGTGKSSLLKSLIVQDMGGGSGVCVFDPHGDLVTELLSLVPKNRLNDVLYLNFTDKKFCYPVNSFECKSKSDSDRIVAMHVSIFKSMFKDSWGPRLEFILRNALIIIIGRRGSSMHDLYNFFVDESYARKMVMESKDSPSKHFFEKTYFNWQSKFREEAISPIINKIGQFWSIKLVRDTFGNGLSVIDFDFLMNNQKIIFVNLAKGAIGEDVSKFMGSLLFGQLYNVALHRSRISIENRRDFYVYMDEFQNFATDVFASVLSEARKYRFNLILAHQFVSQLDEHVRDAVFGNVGNLLSFQVGPEDAEILSVQFEDFVESADMLGLLQGNAYMKIHSASEYVSPFSLKTNNLLIKHDVIQVQKIKKLSRERFASRC